MSRKLLAIILGICVGVLALLELPSGPPPATSAPERLGRSPSASHPSGPAVPDELLVRFARSADASDRARLREAADTDLERTLPVPRLQLLDVEGGQSV